MASVDGSRSYLASSDEVLQHTCGPCKDDGETKEAEYLCEICKSHLCSDCRNDHNTFKATKKHSIVSAHLTQGLGSTTTKVVFAILCGCDQKRAAEVYCEKHVEVICPICEAINHRNCKTCPIADKVTKNAKKQLKEVTERAKSLKAEIELLKKDGEAYCKKLHAKTEECKKEITAFRREINKILDKMEEEILVTLDKRSNQKLQAIEKHISALTTSLQALDTDLDTVDTAHKANRDEIMFSANVKLSKGISAYNELTKDIRNSMQSPNLEFQENKKLIDVLKSVEGYGRIEIVEADSTKQDHLMILDMKVKSTKKVSIQLSDDSTTPLISRCTFLSNGRVILCDYQNKKVKLLDSDMSVKQSLKLPYTPYNVATIGENEAIITFGRSNNDLQYINTHPDLKLGKKITLPNKCFGLRVVNDEIYTTCHKDSRHDEIWKLDRAGNIMSKIVLTQNSSGRSDYLGLCLAGSSPCVYLTDWDNSRVTCVQLDGKMMYQYQDKEQLVRPNGIYVDSAGNSLVCGTDSNNVVVITADGRKHGELLTSKDISKPRCIDYRPEDNTLILGCDNYSKLFVFTLGK